MAGHEVLGPHGPTQPSGDLAQHGVPGGVSEAVVDGLEAVEVDGEDRDRAIVALGASQRQLQVMFEHGSVRKVGEFVVIGKEGEALLRALARADVLHLGDEAKRVAVGVARQGHAQDGPHVVAVGVKVALLRLVGADLPGQHLAHVPAIALHVIGVSEIDERHPHQFLL